MVALFLENGAVPGSVLRLRCRIVTRGQDGRNPCVSYRVPSSNFAVNDTENRREADQSEFQKCLHPFLLFTHYATILRFEVLIYRLEMSALYEDGMERDRFSQG